MLSRVPSLLHVRIMSFYSFSDYESQRGTKILVKGDPGIGKSTFVKKLMYDWATDLFVTFSLIFTISLKLVNSKDPIENMIIEQSPPLVDSNIKPAVIKAMLKQHEKILLILDGYDEMSENARDSPYLKQLLLSELYGNTNLIMTSRPQMTTDIERLFTSVASIEGFSREKAEQFVEKFFPDDPDKVQSIMEFTGRSGIRDMWRIPILLLFICVLVESDLLDISPSSNVAMNTIYDKLIECVFRRHLAKKGKAIDKKELDRLIQEKVIKFGQIAFESLGDDSNVFNSGHITSLVGPEAFDYGLIIGAVDRTMVFCDHGDVKVSFLHRSLQEYLAAHYVVNKVMAENCHLDTVLSEQLKQDSLKKYMLFSSFLYQMLEKSETTFTSTAPTPSKELQVNVTPDKTEMQSSMTDKQSVEGPVQMAKKALLEIGQESLSTEKNVTLTGYAVTPASSQFVMNILKNNSSLVSLSFSNLDLSHCLTQLFASKLLTLEKLSFTRCIFQENENSVAAPPLSGNRLPSLWGFSLSHCEVSTQVAMIMGKALQQCMKLGAVGVYNCTLHNFMTPLLEGTHGELFELSFSKCDICESLEMANNAEISVEQLREVKLRECTLDIGACRLLGKCMSHSMQDLTLDIYCKDPSDLDADLFDQELSSVSTISISRFSRSLPNPSNVEALGKLLASSNLGAKVCNGSLPCVKSITITDIVLKPDVMQSLGSSLQYCQVPFTLKFGSCDIIDGMYYLAEKGLPTMHRLELEYCNLIDTSNTPFKVQVGGFASLSKLNKPTSNDRSLFIGGEPLVNPGLSRGHTSDQSIAILCTAVSSSTTLSVLKIPMTSEAVKVLVDNDLPSVRLMEFYVRNTIGHGDNADTHSHTKHDDKSPLPCRKRFSSLRVLHLFRDGEGSTWPEWPANIRATKSEPPTMASLQAQSWKHFFISLAGNESLTECHFDLMDLTECLAWFLSEQLPSLGILLLNHCKLKENLTDFGKYTGNLPNMPQLRLEASAISDLGNSALRLLCTCLAGSKVLKEFAIDYNDYVRDFHISTDPFKISETPQVHFNNCLSALFSLPLPQLQKVQLLSCVLDEEACGNVVPSPQSVFLPSLTMLDFSESTIKTTTISNSAMQVLSRVLAGSSRLHALSFKGVDCTDCLSLLLSKKYQRLTSIQFQECILDEKSSFEQVDFSGDMPSVAELDISIGQMAKCKYVSNSAAQILCACVGGSTKLSILRLCGANLTGCVPLLLIGPMLRLSELVLNGCTLSEDSMDHEVAGYLPALPDLNLKHCKHVSPFAAGMLLQAVSGSDVLTSVSIAKVDLSTLTTVLFTHDLPSLTHFSLEDCTLSDEQVSSFIQSKKDGFFPALRFMYLNGTNGLSYWFTQKGDQNQCPDGQLQKGGFTCACNGLWVLAIKDCGLTKSDVDGLYQAAKEGTLLTLKQLAISKEELHGVDLKGICRRANISLIH